MAAAHNNLRLVEPNCSAWRRCATLCQIGQSTGKREVVDDATWPVGRRAVVQGGGLVPVPLAATTLFSRKIDHGVVSQRCRACNTLKPVYFAIGLGFIAGCCAFTRDFLAGSQARHQQHVYGVTAVVHRPLPTPTESSAWKQRQISRSSQDMLAHYLRPLLRPDTHGGKMLSVCSDQRPTRFWTSTTTSSLTHQGIIRWRRQQCARQRQSHNTFPPRRAPPHHHICIARSAGDCTRAQYYSVDHRQSPLRHLDDRIPVV